MKLKIRDMEAENDKVVEKDYPDVLDITIEAGEEEDNQFFNQDTRNSFLQGTSHAEHSSRPSAASTFASDYDGSRGEETNDGSDPGNDGRDVRQ
ncbi:hypothetical protein AAG906_000920 [Vitis piasezkii]